MKLSKRLTKIVEMTPSCDRIADIGTDHGYVPCTLLRTEKIQGAVASDVNRKPLEKAVRTASGYGLDAVIDFRLGSGLEVLTPGEVRGAVIAGMGGELTREILEANLEVVRDLEFILLQPAQNPEVVRRYLYAGNYEVIREDLVQEEDGRFYEYFLVRWQDEAPSIPLGPYDPMLSPRLIREKHPLLRAFLEAKIAEIETITHKLDPAFQSSRNKLSELDRQKKYYQEVRSWL